MYLATYMYLAIHVFNFSNIVLVLLLPLIFDHSVFLCSDSNVIEAFKNPTGYCQAQGTYIDTYVESTVYMIARS